jgi:hypothetical protein
VSAVFIAEGSGHWLGWHAVVFAADEQDALAKANDVWVDDVGRRREESGIEVKQIAPEGVHVLFNGDY